MANELTISASLSFSKGGVTTSQSKTGALVTVTGTEYTQLIQSIGTSEEALDLGDVGTAGYIFVENLDATNYVSIRSGTGVADCIKLKAGEVALFRAASAAPYAIANTAACRIKITIIED